MSFNLGSAHGEIVIDYNGAAVQQAVGDLNSLQQTGTNLMRAGAGVAGFGAAIGGALLGATNQAADFQFQMDAVNAALGGLDASQMEVVTQQALDMGAASKFSAGEVAGVQEQLAKSGLSVEEVTGGATQAVLDLASATGENLTTAANSTASALNLFNLDATQTADVADIITAALNESSATLPDFQRGLNSLGPVMANLNQYADDSEGAFRDSAAAIAYFNSQGLKAADAGVSIARGLTNLADPTSEATALMTSLGISAFDAQGNFKPLPDIMDELNVAMAGMSDSQREAALATIFGAEAADVMNIAVKKGGEGLREYQKQTEANGQAAEQAAIRQDNLRGALEQLSGAVQTAAIGIGSAFLGPLQSLVEGITTLVNAFNGLPAPVKEAIAAFAALAAALALVSGTALTVAGAILRFGPAFAAAAAAAAPFLAIMAAIGAAIGLGILAYKTDFLGFGKAVDKALANAQKAVKAFGTAFGSVFAADQAAGMNALAAGVDAFGNALLAATGIDLVSQFSAAADAIQALGDGFQNAIQNGFNPAAAALGALANAASALGLDDLASRLYDAENAAQLFGKVFETSASIARSAGYGDIAADITALGEALSQVTGIDVRGAFDAAANAAQAFGDAFANARENGIDPLQASLLGLRDALSSLTGINLTPTFDDLGVALQSAADGVKTFVQTLAAGDFSGALSQAQGAITSFKDTIVAGLQSVDIPTIVVNILGWVAGKIADLGDFLAGLFGGGGNTPQAGLGGTGTDGINLENLLVNVGSFLVGAITGLDQLAADLADQIDAAIVLPDVSELPSIQAKGEALGVSIGQELTKAIASGIGQGVSGGGGAPSPGLGGVPGGGSTEANIVEVVFKFLDGIASGIASQLPAIMDQTFGTRFTEVFAADDPAMKLGELILQDIQAQLDTLASSIPTIDLSGITSAFDTLGTNIQNALTTALNSVFGETAQAGLGGTGVTNNIVSQLSDQIYEMFNTAAAEIAARVATIDWSAIPQAVAHGIGDALANFGSALFGANTAKAAGGEGFDPAAAGTQFGDQLAASFASPEFVDAVKASVDAMPAETFSAIGTGLLDKISSAMSTALQTPQTDELTGAPGAGGAMATQIVSNLATAMQTAIDAAPLETFTAIGQSLVTKIQGAISAAMSTASTGGQTGPVGEGAVGGMGAQLVTSLATSIASSITAAPIESFAAIGTALQTKISEVLSTAMQMSGGKGTPQAGLGGTGGGGGIGQAIAQSIADAIGQADFASVATALQTNLSTAITTAMQQVSTVISTSTNVWITTFTTTFTAMAQVALSGMAGVTTAVQTGLEAISERLSSYTNVWISTITTTVAAMTASLTSFATAAAAAGQTAGDGFNTGISSGLQAAAATAQAMVDQIITTLNSAAAGAEAAGAAVGEGFAAGMEASLGRVQAAAAAMADAAAAGLAAAAQIASPSKVSMALGEQFGQGFQLGIAGAAPNASQASFNLGQDSIQALADSLRSKANAKADSLRNLGDSIRENQGLASGGGPTTIETTGTVEMDGEAMGSFTVETVLGGLVGAQRKGGKRRGRAM